MTIEIKTENLHAVIEKDYRFKDQRCLIKIYNNPGKWKEAQEKRNEDTSQQLPRFVELRMFEHEAIEMLEMLHRCIEAILAARDINENKIIESEKKENG